jgi:hypothetical protein
MEAASTTETSVNLHQTTRCSNSEDNDLHCLSVMLVDRAEMSPQHPAGLDPRTQKGAAEVSERVCGGLLTEHSSACQRDGKTSRLSDPPEEGPLCAACV